MRLTTCVLLTLFATTAFADQKKAAGKKAAAPDPMQQMMAAMEKAAMPGAEHKALTDSVGTWAAASKMWMLPGKPPVESQGTEEVKAVLGGRFIEIHFTGMMMGKPFEGIGFEGYDNAKKKWLMTWMDSMGTMILYLEGTGDAKSRTLVGEETTPMGKNPIKFVIKIDSATKHTMEMYAPGMDGKESKMMEIVYTKK